MKYINPLIIEIQLQNNYRHTHLYYISVIQDQVLRLFWLYNFYLGMKTPNTSENVKVVNVLLLVNKLQYEPALFVPIIVPVIHDRNSAHFR